MMSNNQNLVCIEKNCILNRIITNWNDLQEHYHNQHKIYPIEKFEKKFNLKLNQFNQKFRIQLEDNISQFISTQEQQIQQKIKLLFQNFQKIFFELLQEQIQQIDQMEVINSKNQLENNLNMYIEICYGQFGSSQKQLDFLFDEIQYYLNRITNDFMKFIDQLEQQQIFNKQQFVNKVVQKKEDFNYQTKFNINQNSNQSYQNKYEYYNLQQESNFDYFQGQQQDNQNSIPLKNYKKAQKQQIYSPYEQQMQQQSQQFQQQNLFQEQQQKYTGYFPKTAINQNDDRISFQLPSETNYNQNNILKNGLDVNLNQKMNDEIQEQKQINVNQNNQQNQKQQNNDDEAYKRRQNDEVQDDKAQQKTNIIGKKFDITNSDKHLKYSLRFTQFSCVQQGVALVEGVFTLEENSKVKFKFTERLDKILTASFGIINVDNNGKKIGTQNYYMDQSGLIYKNERQRQGSIKIGLNEEYILSYRAEKRLLCFRKQEVAEYLHIEGSISGNFKFYVKLYGMQVQIIK